MGIKWIYGSVSMGSKRVVCNVLSGTGQCTTWYQDRVVRHALVLGKAVDAAALKRHLWRLRGEFDRYVAYIQNGKHKMETIGIASS